MNAEDLQELYKLVRGSRAAMQVLDARSLFQEKKMIEAHALMVEAREKYAEGRTRLFRQTADQDAKGKEAQRQAKRVLRKQDQAHETLKRFDELIEQLEKLAEREQRQQPQPGESLEAGNDSAASRPINQREKARSAADASDLAAADSSASNEQPESGNPPSAIASTEDLTSEFASNFAQASEDAQVDLVGQHFGFLEVASEDDVHSDALYFIHSDQKNYLVRTLDAGDDQTEISLVGALDNQPMKPLSRKAFLRLGRKRKMVLLTRKPDESREEPASETENEQDEAKPTDSLQDTAEPKVIDMGAFSQLLTSAQRSGLVPAADQIAHVRDREFRKGNYDLAFQTIDGLFAKFTASMNARNQQLIREDADIASGKVKMSPKDLQAKRARDLRQTQEIDRARRRFQIVLEGLRLLMNAK